MDVTAPNATATTLTGSAELMDQRHLTPQPLRVRVSAILASVAARKAEEATHRRRGSGDAGPRHFAALKAGLRGKIQVILWGQWSPDWMRALAPSAPVWRELDLVGSVAHIAANEPDLARAVRPDSYPVLIPLMEAHARVVPAHYARSSSAADVVDLLAEKDLFAVYLAERGLAAFGPRPYWSLDDVRYPCVVKPTDLNGGAGVEIAADPAQLGRIAAGMASHRKKFVVQSCVPGAAEYVTHAVVLGGEILWDMTLRYDAGSEMVIRTADVTQRSRVERVATSPALRTILGRIAADLAISGPVNVDYKIVDGQPVIFEINPRLGGSLMRPENADGLCAALKASVHCAAASVAFFAEVIRRSAFFDAKFYADPVNEFEPPARDLALHYLREGYLHGRDPCGVFSTNDYLALSLGGPPPGINPLAHFELLGRDMGLPVRNSSRRLLKSALVTLNGMPGHLRRRRVPLGLSGKADVSRITSAEASRIIEERKLGTVGNAWHYSWDLERFFPELYLYETAAHSYVFHDRPIPYVSAPAPFFGDDAAVARVPAHRGRFFPYWFLHHGSFESFLDRRSRASGNPGTNFPTRRTYARVKRKKQGEVERLPLFGNERLFIDQFSQWKDRKFNFDGGRALAFYLKVNPRVPQEWFQFYMLRDERSGAGRGVVLAIEDGRSSAMLNLANEPGYGLFMIVEALRLMAGLGYSSVNAGVSGYYGHYKDVIFLDKLETDATGLIPLSAP